MEREKGFDVKKPVLRTILVVVMIAIGFSLAGCNEEMARIQNKQLELQAMVEANAQQIAAIGERIEQNQQELQAGMEQVQNDIRNVAANTAAVNEKQVKLQETVRNSGRLTTDKIALLEQNQTELQTGIQEVRDNSQNVAADMAADITTVKDEQTRLYETVQSNSRDFTNNLAVLEQNQQQWQVKVEELQQNFQVVTTRITAVADDLLKLQEVLQSNIRELVSAMDLNDQEQLKFREKIQKDLLAFDNSISAVKLSQEKMQNQIQDVKSSAEAISSELPEAIEQLREEIARNSSMESGDNESSSPPSETNNTE
jgi:DNA repair exonuclease SbcCD ATPase subunit